MYSVLFSAAFVPTVIRLISDDPHSIMWDVNEYENTVHHIMKAYPDRGGKK